MPTVDPELGEVIGRELAGHGVRLATGVTVRAIHPDNGGLRVLFCLPERVWYPRPAGWSWAADRGRP